jgi:PAS domain S-box-containing protein
LQTPLLAAGVLVAFIWIVSAAWPAWCPGMPVVSLIVAGSGLALIAELRRCRRIEQAALASERRYRFLAEHSFDMIVRFDPRTQRRTYISPACRRMYGYEPEEALAKSAEEIIHPDDLAGVQQALARLEDEPDQPPILYRGRRKDGIYIWVRASLSLVKSPDTGATEIVAVVRNADERVRREAALLQAKEEADAASRSKSHFLATMSHELRTPLNAIIGFADLMRQEVMGPIGNDRYRSYIADIYLSGEHLLQLINDILDLSKAEAGKLELNEEIIDLAAVIGSVMRVNRPCFDQIGLTIEAHLPPTLPLLRADERRTRQVLFNLIGNAVKFTPSGGRIDIRVSADPFGGIRITVSDTGTGIAPEDLTRVVEPFVQAGSAVNHRHSGTGLGLPAVKAIIELHGGVFELKSTVGSGTEAAVVFPPDRIVAATTAAAPVPVA